MPYVPGSGVFFPSPDEAAATFRSPFPARSGSMSRHAFLPDPHASGSAHPAPGQPAVKYTALHPFSLENVPHTLQGTVSENGRPCAAARDAAPRPDFLQRRRCRSYHCRAFRCYTGEHPPPPDHPAVQVSPASDPSACPRDGHVRDVRSCHAVSRRPAHPCLHIKYPVS